MNKHDLKLQVMAILSVVIGFVAFGLIIYGSWLLISPYSGWGWIGLGIVCLALLGVMCSMVDSIKEEA